MTRTSLDRIFFLSSAAPPAKNGVKERRPWSGGVKPVQQAFYTEWKNETGLFCNRWCN